MGDIYKETDFRRILFIIMIIFNIFSTCLSCGMTTHTEISRKAYARFKNPNSSFNIDYREILEKYENYFYAGSPLPDWGYMCKYSDAAEDMHWPPFIKTYIDYLTDTYSHEDERFKILVSFILGVTSHQYADILWHWGDQTESSTEQGFLRALGHLGSDCEDDWTKCHTRGDNGIDFYLGSKKSLRKNNNHMYWTIPVEDIVKVYNLRGIDIKPKDFERCSFIMFLGLELTEYVSNIVLPILEKKASFLTQNVDLWFNGGLDDMAENITWKWKEVIQMIEQKYLKAIEGTSFGQKVFNFISDLIWNEDGKDFRFPIDRSSIIKSFIYDEILNDQESIELFSTLLNFRSEMDTNTGDVTYRSDKSYFSFNSNIIKDKLKSKLKINTELENQIQYFRYQPSRQMFSLKDPQKFELFSNSMTYGKFMGNSSIQYFIGAPGYGDLGAHDTGAVYLLESGEENEFFISDPHLIGLQAYSKFGFSATAIDINHDGIDDLVVSAPTHGKRNSGTLDDYYTKYYSGEVYIYLGIKDIGIRKNSNPDITINIPQTDDNKFFNLGLFLGSSDCNDDGFKDLIIGSPMAQEGGEIRGSVALFTEKINVDKFAKRSLHLDIKEDSNFYLSGYNDYMEYGNSITCSQKHLFVGSPGYRLEDNDKMQASGSVFVYDLNSLNKESKAEDYSVVLEGLATQSNFGSVLDIYDGILAIGSPSYSYGIKVYNFHQGTVYFYDIEKVIRSSNKKITSEDCFKQLSGNSTRERFGSNVKFYKNNESLKILVAASKFSPSENMIECGRMFDINVTKLLENSPEKKLIVSSEEEIVRGTSVGSQLRTILVNEEKIIIGAPFSGDNNDNGEIFVLNQK